MGGPVWMRRLYVWSFLVSCDKVLNQASLSVGISSEHWPEPGDRRQLARPSARVAMVLRACPALCHHNPKETFQNVFSPAGRLRRPSMRPRDDAYISSSLCL